MGEFDRLAGLSPEDREAVRSELDALLRLVAENGLEPVLCELKGPAEIQWATLARMFKDPELLAKAKALARNRRQVRADRKKKKQQT